ncbi:DnaB-like helicase N-terminal domain-containing protein [Micromonospora sp. NPDC050276]|uniref:DnaB-like helicase N-terminal domain-containing protein n=1 Tax=Micromonospora sp. NPDC050276 TaxID=3364278 RepID=UPI0037910E0A
MLADQPLPAEFDYLRPESFGHRVLRQIYTAVLDLRDYHHGDELTWHVANRVDQPGVDADWLQELRGACPSTTHIASYARMVQVSGFRRTIAEHGERIAVSAITGQPTEQTRTEMTGMAQALTHQAQAYQAFTTIDEQQALRVWRTPDELDAAVTTSERAAREDQLLADPLAHPEQARTVSQIVPPETFTSDQRREVFMTLVTLVTLAAEGEPIDEIILLWEFERLRASADLYGTDNWGNTYRADAHSPEPNAADVARLATMTVINGTAITIGHELVVEDVRNQLQLSAAAALGREAPDVSPTPQSQPAPQHDPTLNPPSAVQRGQQPTFEL